MKKCLMIYSLITGHNSGLYLLISSEDNTKTMFNTWGGMVQRCFVSDELLIDCM